MQCGVVVFVNSFAVKTGRTRLCCACLALAATPTAVASASPNNAVNLSSYGLYLLCALVVAFAAIFVLWVVAKRALMQAEDHQGRLRAIFDNAPVEMYLKDGEGRYIEINRRFEELFDVKNSEIRGRFPSDIHDTELAETTRAQDLEV
jgi:PAS domain-containing protein